VPTDAGQILIGLQPNMFYFSERLTELFELVVYDIPAQNLHLVSLRIELRSML